MLFAIICHDRPGAMQTRLANRPDHLAHLERHMAHLVHAGPLLDDSEQPLGSMFIVDFPDRAAAERFAADDPFAKTGVFGQTEIRLTRRVYPQG